MVTHHEGVIFRGVGGEETRISQVLFSTFHGGNKPKWAPKAEDGSYVTHSADFDQMTVHPGLYVLRPMDGDSTP